MKPYTDTLWGALTTVALPVDYIFDRHGNIALAGCDLSTFVHCCVQANRLHSNCTFAAPIRELEAGTGYSHAQLERSLKKLQQGHLIQKMHSFRFESAKYAISSKVTGIPLAELYGDEMDGRKTPSLRTVLRNAKLIYFTVPKATLKRLAELKGPALAALLSLIKHAGELREPEFSINVQQLRKMSRIACNETLFAAAEAFEDTIQVFFESGAHHATVCLLNPETGRDISDEKFENELAKKPVQAESPYTRAELEAWFKSEFPDAIPNGNDLIIHCHRCREINPNRSRPTLRYDAGKGFWGVFYCDECRYGRRLTPVHLLAEIRGVSEQQVERQIEKFVDQIRSQTTSVTNVTRVAAAKATS